MFTFLSPISFHFIHENIWVPHRALWRGAVTPNNIFSFREGFHRFPQSSDNAELEIFSSLRAPRSGHLYTQISRCVTFRERGYPPTTSNYIITHRLIRAGCATIFYRTFAACLFFRWRHLLTSPKHRFEVRKRERVHGVNFIVIMDRADRTKWF